MRTGIDKVVKLLVAGSTLLIAYLPAQAQDKYTPTMFTQPSATFQYDNLRWLKELQDKGLFRELTDEEAAQIRGSPNPPSYDRGDILNQAARSALYHRGPGTKIPRAK